jgi:hypothetical protein
MEKLAKSYEDVPEWAWDAIDMNKVAGYTIPVPK